MRIFAVAVLAACSSSSSPPPLPAPSPPAPAPAPVEPGPVAPDAADLAPMPYTAEQIREANPAGRVVTFRRELGDATSIVAHTFVAVDEQGAEIEVLERDAKGQPAGAPQRARSTWEELRRHASFPRARTAITDGVADTPAGKFPSKIYTVTDGDEVNTFYFALDRAGPPVLFHRDVGGKRVMTNTLIPNVEPPPSCKTDDDCWFDGNRPIARPRSERGRRMKPCRDGSRIPSCKAGACAVTAYKC
jgi:hypothetical protein